MANVITPLSAAQGQGDTSLADNLVVEVGLSGIETDSMLGSSINTVVIAAAEKTTGIGNLSVEIAVDSSTLSNFTQDTFETVVADTQEIVSGLMGLADNLFALGTGDPLLTSTQTTTPSTATTSVLVGSGGLTFQFNAAEGTPQEVIDGFVEAGELWSNLFSDPVTIVVNIAYEALGPGVLGATGSSSVTLGYGDVVTALTGDASSSSDNTAVNNLPSNSIDMLINHTRQNRGRSTPYLDSNGSANNTNLTVNTANAKVLGFDVGDVIDGDITFSSNFNWDFDRSDGITSRSYDFVGVAAHEIGHALGFVSNIDLLDAVGASPLDRFISEDFYSATVLDLFRFSTESAAQGAIDFTTGDTANSDRYFSIDGGLTNLALFSTGTSLGDGNQASHWKDNLGIGIMDPTISSGELADITGLDVQAFDVIGYDVTVA